MRKVISILMAVSLGGFLLALAACGGSGSSSTTSNPSSTTSPMFMTAGDAPLTSVLAAMVTVSAVNFTSSTGTATQVLSKPRTIELTQLGGIRAPLELDSLPDGTYTSVAITVSAAAITYPGANGPVVANATLASPTATIQLSPSFVVANGVAIDLRFDFDLSDSIDLTNGVVTFTPDISAAIARVQDESNPNRVIYVNGVVTAVSTANNTITLQAPDTQLQVTLNVNSNTVFDDNLTLAGIQVGTFLKTEAQLGTDGTLTALLVEDANGGATIGNGGRLDIGIVTGTVLTNNALSSFTMFVRNSSIFSNIGQVITVTVNSNSTFKITKEATNAGLPLFDQTQVQGGVGLQVASTGATSTSTSVTASQIRPAAVFPHGLTVAAVTAANGGFVIPMVLDNNGNFSKYSGVAALDIDTNANTNFDGKLTSSNVGSLAIGTPLLCDCFAGFANNTYTLYSAALEQTHK